MARSFAKRYVLAIDSSSSAVETCIFDAVDGKILHVFSEEITVYSPNPGWVEYDAEEIWQKQLLTINQALSHVSKDSIIGIGISNQRETIVAWDKNTLKPVCRAISWQDSRNHIFIKRFQDKSDLIYEKTGLFLDHYFSASKMSWILENVKVDIDNLRFGTIDSWLIANFTDGLNYFTDITNASRTMCMNLDKEVWDSDLLSLFGIPEYALPNIKPSDSCFGYWNDIPIMGVMGDQQAALFSLGNKLGTVACTYGTGLFVLQNTGTLAKKDKKNLTTVAWKLGSEDTVYAVENGSFSCGNTLEKLKREGLVFSYNPNDLSIPISVYVEPINNRLFLFSEHKFWKTSKCNLDLKKDAGNTVLKSFLNGLSLIVKKIIDNFEIECKDVYLNGQLSNIDYLSKVQSLVLGKSVILGMQGSRTIMGISLLVMMANNLIEWRDVDFWNMYYSKKIECPKINTIEAISLINLWLSCEPDII